MFKPSKMRIADLTCLSCGSKLEIKFSDAIIGDNKGECPMCQEPYKINITKDEMDEFNLAEEEYKELHGTQD